MDSNSIIQVFGWYNNHNIGDESYKLSFPKIFNNNNFVFSSNIIEKADAYIIGGGDILTSNLLEKFQKIKKPKHIMSVTVSKDFDSSLFQDYRTIIVRDCASQERLKKINVSSFLYPDFGFALEGNKENGTKLIAESFERNKKELYTKKIAVIVNGHLLPSHDKPAYEHARFNKMCFDLSIAIDETPASFIFIPFSTLEPWDDRITNAHVSSKCKWWKKNVSIYNDLSVQESLDIISSCDAVVSTRLHSSIFSAAAEIPFIDITHNHKNRYFLETIKYEKASIGYEEFNVSKMKSMLKSILSNRNSYEEIGSNVSFNKFLLKDLDKNVLLT